MKEAKKTPEFDKKLIYFYGIIIILLIALNYLILPVLKPNPVKEVDYKTFLTKIDQGKVESVEVQENEIEFTITFIT